MKKKFVLFALFALCRIAAEAQECATVSLAASAVSNTKELAQVNIVNCRGDASSGFVEASVTTATSNNAAARPLINTKLIAADGTTSVQISAQTVSACTSVTLTFTIKFKVKKIDGTIGPEQVKTITKTFIVCPFRLDPQVIGVAVVPAEAGKDSQVTITLVNQGAHTPLPGGGGSYSVNLTLVEDTSGLIRNSCTTSSPQPTLTSFPVLKPGEKQTLNQTFKFPQAGAFNLKAEISLNEIEDGPKNNNSQTKAVTVPLPKPLVCEVAPLNAKPGDPVKISGNWFRTFGTTETPTVKFGAVAAQGLNVASPLNMTVNMPDLACTATGQVSVTVSNASGATVFRNGPTFPGTLSITSTSRDASPAGADEDLIINLANFRSNCTFTVTLEPGPTTPGGALTSRVMSTTSNSITVRIRPPSSGAAYTLKVQTPYGLATKPITVGG